MDSGIVGDPLSARAIGFQATFCSESINPLPHKRQAICGSLKRRTVCGLEHLNRVRNRDQRVWRGVVTAQGEDEPPNKLVHRLIVEFLRRLVGALGGKIPSSGQPTRYLGRQAYIRRSDCTADAVNTGRIQSHNERSAQLNIPYALAG